VVLGAPRSSAAGLREGDWRLCKCRAGARRSKEHPDDGNQLWTPLPPGPPSRERGMSQMALVLRSFFCPPLCHPEHPGPCVTPTACEGSPRGVFRQWLMVPGGDPSASPRDDRGPAPNDNGQACFPGTMRGGQYRGAGESRLVTPSGMTPEYTRLVVGRLFTTTSRRVRGQRACSSAGALRSCRSRPTSRR
jgi:hypothetical protein